LKLVKEVSLELSKAADEKVVMWVFDSFSYLVSNALEAKEEKDINTKATYEDVISMLVALNTSIIPIAVSSSATIADELRKRTLSHDQSALRYYFAFYFNFNLLSFT
jgi:hypothetical protein